MMNWLSLENDLPLMFVIGGPNGAGKTTTAGILLPQALTIDQFVNADLIAQGLSPFAPQSTALDAGYLMLERIHELAGRRVSFGFETTMASRSYGSFLRKHQQKGYVINIAYVWLSNVDLALARIAERVRQGGHDVPTEDVKRRFQRGLKNFFEIYQPLADGWTLCDNSTAQLRIVAQADKASSPTVFDEETFDQIKRSYDHAK